MKNKLHCYYLMGLGYLGFREIPKARKAFECVLKANTAHVGVIAHLALIDSDTVFSGVN